MNCQMTDLIRQLVLLLIAVWVMMLATDLSLFYDYFHGDSWLWLMKLMLIFALGAFLPAGCRSTRGVMALIVLVIGMGGINTLFSAWLTGTASLWKLSLTGGLFALLNAMLGLVAPAVSPRYRGMTRGQWIASSVFVVFLLAACVLPWLNPAVLTADANVMGRYLALAVVVFITCYRRLSALIQGDSLVLNLQRCASGLIATLIGIVIIVSMVLEWINSHSQFQMPLKHHLGLIFIYGLLSLLYLCNNNVKRWFPAFTLGLAIVWSLWGGVYFPQVMLPVLPIIGLVLGLFLPVSYAFVAVGLWLSALVLPGLTLGFLHPEWMTSFELGSGLLIMSLGLNRGLEKINSESNRPLTGESSDPVSALDAAKELQIEHRSLAFGLVGFVLFLLVGGGGVNWNYQNQKRYIREQSQLNASTVAEKLVHLLSGVEIATHSLNPLALQAIRSQRDFEHYTGRIVDLVGKGVTLQWAPQAVVSYIHPLAEHEPAIGHDLLADPERRDDIKRLLIWCKARSG